MKAAMKKVSVFAGMLSCCAILSGCLSHWLVDSTTRLQIENNTDWYITGFDVRADDGSYWRWVKDTIAPGEKSRVYEEDFVGTFKARLGLMRNSCLDSDSKAMKKDAETTEYVKNCSVTTTEEFFKVKFDGGSYYMVAKEVDGELKLEFR